MEKEMINEYAKRYGTPFYLFDADVLEKRIAYLKDNLSAKTQLCYAIKANPFITKEVSPFVGRLEICSEGEYRVCEALELDAEKFVISGVNKNPEFIYELIASNVNIGAYTIESMEHFSIILSVCQKTSHNARVLLRLTSGNQFGLDEDEMEEIIRNRDQYPCIQILGVQYFSGTQKTSLKKLKREIDYVDGFVAKLGETYGFDCEEVEFGPGLPVYYFEGETFDETAFLTGFNEMLDNMSFGGRVVLELGRSIAASCGIYITRVADIKCNRGENYAILDGGMHQITYYGQFMAMKHPKIEHIGTEEGETKNWTLCGSLCSVNDLLVKQYPICNLQKGDFLIFKETGAYCMTEGISLFLSRDLPAVLLKRTDETVALRERFYTHVLNTPNYK